MKIIGLTGGIASGKSAVARELAELGAVVLDADQAAHEVLKWQSVQQLLVERWGTSILNPDAQINRAELARRVFGEDENARRDLDFLEQILHPRIREQFEEKLADLRPQAIPAVIIDAPLLLEAGWESLCDCLVFVDSPREARLERARSRNWTAAEFYNREAQQMPIAEKRTRSTHILDNSGTLAGLRAQVRDLWYSLGFPDRDCGQT